MSILKKHWPTLALLAGFLLSEGIIFLVAFPGIREKLPENADLIEAIMGALGSLIWILLLYLCALVCAALALRFSLKKLDTGKDVASIVITAFSVPALGTTLVQAVAVIWHSLAWIAELPGLLG